MKKSIYILMCISLATIVSSCGQINEDTSSQVNYSLSESVEDKTIADTSIESSEDTTSDVQSEETNEDTVDYEKIYEDFMNSYDYDAVGGNIDAISTKYEDVNEDGIPELFFSPGTAVWLESLYTIYHGECVQIGQAQSSSGFFFTNLEGTPYFLGEAGSSFANGFGIYEIVDGEAYAVLAFEQTNVMEYNDSLYTDDIINAEYVFYYEGNSVEQDEFIKQMENLIGSDKTSEILENHLIN